MSNEGDDERAKKQKALEEQKASMTISQDGIDLIKSFEGCKLTAYQCPANVWTIGYGHTANVKQGQTITQEEAEAFLESDLQPFVKAVRSKVNELLTQNQFDALVSFAFNVGVSAFSSSTLLKKVNADPNDKTISDAFARWNKAGGKVSQGLVNRRNKEASFYFGN